MSSSKVSITPLLKRLWPSPAETNVTADEIALAISHIFQDELSPVQTGALLTALHFTGWDRRADVIARCAQVMREAASTVDISSLQQVVQKRNLAQGRYRGGLCDIVGTGGDNHSTFNVSTTASIIASSHLLVAKHGNRASTSMSGSADVLTSMLPLPPKLEYVQPSILSGIYERSNYAFLYAPVFHPGMRHVATVRKELGWRTIFNLLGPLANPVHDLIEARIIGVARRDLGPVFAEALRMSGARKAMVVCGKEDLDEISCAGKTFCWRLIEVANPAYPKDRDNDGDDDDDDDDDDTSDDDELSPRRTIVEVESFTICPADFGLPAHSLSTVAPGMSPSANAALLKRLLENDLPKDDPVLHFVLMNTAALLEVAGVCYDREAEQNGECITETGPGRGRWKEGVRRARLAIENGDALRAWNQFVDVTNER
ncbi:MAG: hypothetical protein M1823_002919 [Watsoniomyces obsoletus]|nr:MAG: hypothetical protein M1823_002919 [Watsoniomyces obsoletus]